jgi:hypothetical protein
VGSKAFIIGTILGPLLIFGLFGIQFLVLAKSGGGEHRVALLDATERGLGDRIVAQVESRDASPSFIERASYVLSVETPSATSKREAVQAASERVVAKELDGFLWIPPDVITGAAVEYEGSNAQNSRVTNELQRAVQRVVQSERLQAEGIDEERLGGALASVDMTVMKTGERGEVGNPAAAMMLAFGMAFAIYIVVIMYGQSIMTSVQEEKRDRIVELIVSSVRARDLLVGKVLGIGAELARTAAREGAYLLIVPSCTDDRHGFLRVRYCAHARAIENQMYVIQSSTVGSLPMVPAVSLNYGQAAILTPSDFSFARDGILAEGIPNQEMMVIGDVNLTTIAEGRRTGTVLPLRDSERSAIVASKLEVVKL